MSIDCIAEERLALETTTKSCLLLLSRSIMYLVERNDPSEEMRGLNYLLVSESRERVNNQTKDDVQANCGDDNEEGEVEDDSQSHRAETVVVSRNNLCSQ